jgi:hypothetical protein
MLSSEQSQRPSEESERSAGDRHRQVPRGAVCVAANAACNCPARYILRTMKVVTFAKEVDYVPYGPN